MTAARIIMNEIKGYHRFLKVMIFLVVVGALASAARFIFGLGRGGGGSPVPRGFGHRHWWFD